MYYVTGIESIEREAWLLLMVQHARPSADIAYLTQLRQVLGHGWENGDLSRLTLRGYLGT